MNENRKTNLSTGIYVRVSTEEQAQEGFSIRAQTEKLKSYALLKGWDIFDIYADEGISGKNIVDRPAMNRLIDDIEKGNVNNVLVFKVDRLTRSTKNLLELVELFDEFDCAFNSLTESIDTDTPSGRMFLKIIGIFAEFERENIGERSRIGKERKAKEGYTIASWSLSYGYDRAKGQKIQTINTNEAEIVKEIFAMYVDKNMSMNKIARTLNKRKVPTKMSGVWNSSTVRLILLNPTYIGKVRYSVHDEDRYFEAEGHHEPILTDEMFYLANEKIKKLPSQSRTKTPREESYFSGLLICLRCKGKFTTHNCVSNNNGKSYKTSYRCRTRKDCSVEKCVSPNIIHAKVEQAFCEYIQNINDITEDKDIDIDKSVQSEEQELLKNIADSEKRLKTLQNRKNQVMEQYVQGDIEFEEYKRMVKMFNEKHDALENELLQKKAELSTATKIPDIFPEDIILNLKQNWTNLTNSEKAIFLQRFVKSITIMTEKERVNSSIVKIDNIEFHTGKLQTKDFSVRGTLRKRKSSLIRTDERLNNTSRNTPVLV